MLRLGQSGFSRYNCAPCFLLKFLHPSYCEQQYCISIFLFLSLYLCVSVCILTYSYICIFVYIFHILLMLNRQKLILSQHKLENHKIPN